MKSADHPTLRQKRHRTLLAVSAAETAATVLSAAAFLVGIFSVGVALTVLGSNDPGSGLAAVSSLVGGGASAFGLYAVGVALRLGAAIARELRQQTAMQAATSGLQDS